MPKKNFKDNPALAFIGTRQETEETVAPVPEETKPGQNHSGHYRVNLKLKAEYKTYLDGASWRSKKSITQYINDLIAADREANQK
jgi:hypothetical protein